MVGFEPLNLCLQVEYTSVELLGHRERLATYQVQWMRSFLHGLAMNQRTLRMISYCFARSSDQYPLPVV